MPRVIRPPLSGGPQQGAGRGAGQRARGPRRRAVSARPASEGRPRPAVTRGPPAGLSPFRCNAAILSRKPPSNLPWGPAGSPPDFRDPSSPPASLTLLPRVGVASPRPPHPPHLSSASLQDPPPRRKNPSPLCSWARDLQK